MAVEDHYSRTTAAKDILELLDRIEELKGEDRENDNNYMHMDEVNDEYVLRDYQFDDCPGCDEYYGQLQEAKEEIDNARSELSDLKQTIESAQDRLDDAHSVCEPY